MRLACAALMLGAAAPPPTLPAPVVIRHQDVPLITVYAWERWGNFINALAGSKTEIPYDAARLQVKVYTFPTGEIRAIRFGNGVRTHRHINQTDTILYSWQAHRVQFVDDKAVVTGPGDFALHQKGVNHSGEEIRRGGGIDLEFAMTIAGRHNDPAAWWSLARDHAVQPAASWLKDGRTVEAIGPDAAAAPSGAAHYQVRVAALPHFGARELYLAKGSILPSRDMAADRLFFLLSGHVKLTTAGKSYLLEPEDSARAIRGADFTLEAIDDAMFAEAFVPAAN
ncbi:MAG: hypothetical protein ABIQ98_04030 [Sphingomicrobium sp.]